MDDIIVALSIFLAITGTLTIVFGVAWLRAQHRNRLLERQWGKTPGDGTLERLEEEVESLSRQVAHLAKGQEFLSRFLSERVPVRLRRPEDQSHTPS